MLIRRNDFQQLRDQQFVLEAALADARRDLADAGSLDAYPEVFATVAHAIEGMVGLRLEPKAIGG